MADSDQATAKLRDSKSTHCPGPRDQQAVSYVAQVKATFGANSSQYRAFSKTLKAHMTKSIPTQEAVQRIQELFEDHRELMMRFNDFLPLEFRYKVKLPPKEDDDCTQSFSSLVPQNAAQPPSAKKKEAPILYEEDPPLEAELLVIRQLQQELEDLKIKKQLLQNNELVLSTERQQQLEDIEWEIRLVYQTVVNIELGIELRRRSNGAGRSYHHIQREGSVTTSGISGSQRLAYLSLASVSISEDSSEQRLGNEVGVMCLQEISPDLKPTRDLVGNETSSQDDGISSPKMANKTPALPINLMDSSMEILVYIQRRDVGLWMLSSAWGDNAMITMTLPPRKQTHQILSGHHSRLSVNTKALQSQIWSSISYVKTNSAK